MPFFSTDYLAARMLPFAMVIGLTATLAACDPARGSYAVDGRNLVATLLPEEEHFVGGSMMMTNDNGEPYELFFDGLATYVPVVVTAHDGQPLDPLADLEAATEAAARHCATAGYRAPDSERASPAEGGGIRFPTCGAQLPAG